MPFRGRGETVDQISRYIKCGVIFISWGRKSSDKVGVQYGGCGRVRTRSHDKRDETRVGCLSGLQLGKVRLKMRVEKLEQGVQVKGWIQGQRGDYRPSGGLRDWSGQFVIFFFSNAARTITALTVMRSGRKLRHLDNVGSHSKQHKHKTQPKTTKQKTTDKKGLPKSENKGETG